MTARDTSAGVLGVQGRELHTKKKRERDRERENQGSLAVRRYPGYTGITHFGVRLLHHASLSFYNGKLTTPYRG